MSEPHQIVAKGQETYAPVTNSTLRCPRCLTSWDGGPIPEAVRQHYSPPYRWSKLVGVEIPGVYDGVHHWKCFSCQTTFPRWIEDAEGKPVHRMFRDEKHLEIAPVFQWKDQNKS